MKKLFVILLIVTLFLVACKGNQANEEIVVDADQPVPEEPAEDTTVEDTTQPTDTTTTDNLTTETEDDTVDAAEPEENLTDATVHKVRVTKSDLTPQHITIKNGDTVTWTNGRKATTASAGKFMVLFQSPYREIRMTNEEQNNKEWSYTFEGFDAGTKLRYGEVIFDFSGTVTIEE